MSWIDYCMSGLSVVFTAGAVVVAVWLGAVIDYRLSERPPGKKEPK